MLYQALVFVRRNAAYGIGHVGWAFTLSEGIFNAGAVENHHGGLITPSSRMGFWMLHTYDPTAPMRKRRYTEFKVIQLEEADPATAEGVARWVGAQAYEFIGRNCMDDTYDVLRTYGVKNLPPPATHWEPNYWFDAIAGDHFSIKDKGFIRHPTVDTPPVHVMPAWRQANAPESEALQMSIHATPPMAAARKRYPRFALPTLFAKVLHRLAGRLVGMRFFYK
ncbi:MAG: hypothetical protein R3C14_09990 [Caldilineaceae bacterium]